jgi:hypothetical protein
MALARAEYRYQAWVLEALASHGVRPAVSTPPELLHDFVNDLYRYELRRLRASLLAGVFPKAEYYGRVVALRRRYPLLSIKSHLWLAEADPGGSGTAGIMDP